jgi:3-oxoacyl-[acyl-carrier-protein] synthase-3
MNIISDYGNCVSASIPLALSLAIRENKIKRGDIVLIIGTGAGLSVSASLIKF